MRIEVWHGQAEDALEMFSAPPNMIQALVDLRAVQLESPKSTVMTIELFDVQEGDV